MIEDNKELRRQKREIHRTYRKALQEKYPDIKELLYNNLDNTTRREESILDKARAAYKNNANNLYNNLEMDINDVISTSNNIEYICIYVMAVILGYTTTELCDALEEYKRTLPKEYLLDGSYGNPNYYVYFLDSVSIQGWINFLSIPRFADSEKSKRVVEILQTRV